MTDPLWTSDDRHLVHYLMMGNGTTNKVFYGYGNIEDYEAFWTDMSGSSSGGGMTLLKKYNTPKLVGDLLEIGNLVNTGDTLVLVVQVTPGSYTPCIEGNLMSFVNVPAKSSSVFANFLTIPTYGNSGTPQEGDHETFQIIWQTGSSDFMVDTMYGNAEIMVWRVYKL